MSEENVSNTAIAPDRSLTQFERRELLAEWSFHFEEPRTRKCRNATLNGKQSA